MSKFFNVRINNWTNKAYLDHIYPSGPWLLWLFINNNFRELMQITSVSEWLVRKGPVYIALFISLPGQVRAADCVRLFSKLTSSLIYACIIDVLSIFSNFGPLTHISKPKAISHLFFTWWVSISAFRFKHHVWL